jgi:hypothetical protein
MDSIVTQWPGSGSPEPENNRYLVPKEVWHRYCRSYSTFMKRLNVIVRKGKYRDDAFRVMPQLDLRKRSYNQFEIHSVWGIEVLDKYFSARNVR